MLEKFKDMSNLLKDNVHFINRRKQEIEQKVDFYIDKDMFDLVMEYRINGYVLNKQQEKKFFKKYIPFNKESKIAFFCSMIEKNKDIPNNLLLELFTPFTLKITLVDGDQTYENFYMRQENAIKKILNIYRNKVSEKKLDIMLLEDVLQSADKLIRNNRIEIFLNTSTENIKNEAALLSKKMNVWFNLCGDITNTQNHKLLIEKIDKINKKVAQHNYLFGGLYSKLQKSYERCISEEIEKDAQDMKIIYNQSSNINELVQQRYLLDKTNNNIDNLPKNIKLIVDNISENYMYLVNNEHNLSADEKFKLHNLWENRIPEIINVYLKADISHRTLLKDNMGRNIEDLTRESLVEIKSIFTQIHTSLGEKSLSDAAALKRYVKSL